MKYITSQGKWFGADRLDLDLYISIHVINIKYIIHIIFFAFSYYKYVSIILALLFLSSSLIPILIPIVSAHMNIWDTCIHVFWHKKIGLQYGYSPRQIKYDWILYFIEFIFEAKIFWKVRMSVVLVRYMHVFIYLFKILFNIILFWSIDYFEDW